MAVDLSTRTPNNLAALSKATQSTVAVKSHQMLALPSKPENPGDLRPISLSSTDSFLAAERACAASDFGEDPICEPMKSPLITTTAASGPQPQTINNEALSEHPQLDGADVTTCHHNPMYTDNDQYPFSPLNFPDIQRPSSPCAGVPVRDRIVSPGISLKDDRQGPTAAALSGGLNSQGKQPANYRSSSASSASSVIRNTTGAVCQANGHGSQSPVTNFHNVPALILWPTEFNSPDTAEQDGTEAEYLGTYSLGPASLAVQPSITEDGYGNGMTDSLLANPDLDARDSELGDEFDLVGSLNAPPTSSISPRASYMLESVSSEQLFGRIESKQAPEFLEAALLPPLPTPSCTNGCDTNTKELYSIPPTEDVLTSDTDDLFAYHIRPGMDQNPATAIVAMQSRGPQFAIHDQSKQNNAITPITACLPMSPMSHLPGRPTVSSHAVLRLNPQATRPTLPDIAPVSLPDFAQPLGLVPQTETNGAQSDYDNVCMSTRQRPARSKGASVKPGCASARKLAAGARRRANRWQSLTPGDESDAMSGSEYDNVNTNGPRGGKHPSEEDSLNKKSTSPSLSLQHATPHRTGSFNAKRSEITQRLFDSEIAAEARRISRQFRAMGWLPATSSVYSPVAQHSPTEVDKAFGIHTAGSALPNLHQKPVAIARPHLFLLPMDVSVSNPCSRQPSFRNRPLVGSGVGGIFGGSMMDSETTTTVTSQFDDEDDEEENDEFAPQCGQNGRDPSGFLGGLSVRPGENGFHVPWDVGCDRNSPDAQLGCLLVRPRSLSATCLSGDVTADAYRDPFLSSSSSDLSSDAQSDEEGDADGQNEKAAQNSGQAQSAKQFDKKSHIPVLVVRRPDQLPGVSTHSSGRQNSHLLTDSSAVKRPDVSPGLTRLQRRAARVRSLIPPDLLPYILPSCMSSPSRSSSMVSSAFGLSSIVFLSLARSRRSRQKMNRLKRDRSVVLEINRRRCTSDPELNLTCR
ncbi:hypothetical protein FGIG_04653 [Fasciola gigantica]|uniref:Uncharacterized protein n=1 Tax=Fasciola gigantica TaxID=46835 RepID=A0A504YZ24_FASGI|nr:hypothetical protein FGIG_04653 [Fasciola gigantica]